VVTPEGQVEPGASPVAMGKPSAPPVPRLGDEGCKTKSEGATGVAETNFGSATKECRSKPAACQLARLSVYR
jgi:hypothetical protein